MQVSADARNSPDFIFGLDGTLVDSVYQRLLREALECCVAVWRIRLRPH